MSLNLDELGYSKFETIENQNALYKLSDGTFLETSVILKNVLYQNPNSVGLVDAIMNHTTYTTKELRSQSEIQVLSDVSYESIQEGKFVFEVNGHKFTIIPVIIQIKRTAVRDNLNNIVYHVMAHAKSLTEKL